MGIKEFLFKRRVRRSPRTVSYVGWNDVSRVVLLFHSSTVSAESAAGMMKRLRSERKEVAGYYYVGDKRSMPEVECEGLCVFTRKDVGITGKPKRSGAVNVPENGVDVVIDLSFSRSYPLAYIALWSEAKLLCGAEDDGAGLLQYDFRIALSGEDSGSADFLLEQTVKYLKMIKGGE